MAVLHMVCHANNSGRRFALDRFIGLKQKVFGPIVINDRSSATSCASPYRIASTLSTLGIENSFSHWQKHRFSHRTASCHYRFLPDETASPTRHSVPSIPSFSPRLGAFNLHNFAIANYAGNQYQRISSARRFYSDNVAPLVSFSSISETPLDSAVMEKPYTMILMEDDVSESFFHSDSASFSWNEIFRSKIPRDYGMSFASITLQMKTGDTTTTTSIPSTLEALKASQLPMMADAILVARGPCSSLVAQYYLESFPLKGLIMIDPILLPEDGTNSNYNSLSSRISGIYKDDTESLKRFRSQRLLVEPNAVPMMVIRTISEKEGNHYPAWRAASLHVAERHGDADGLYGEVPVLDQTFCSDDTSEAFAVSLLKHIDNWIDEEL